jgi:hypothetical protein
VRIVSKIVKSNAICGKLEHTKELKYGNSSIMIIGARCRLTVQYKSISRAETKIREKKSKRASRSNVENVNSQNKGGLILVIAIPPYKSTFQ